MFGLGHKELAENTKKHPLKKPERCSNKGRINHMLSVGLFGAGTSALVSIFTGPGVVLAAKGGFVGGMAEGMRENAQTCRRRR